MKGPTSHRPTLLHYFTMLSTSATRAMLAIANQSILCSSASASAVLFFGRFYHKNVVDHYENPRNVGSMDKKDPNVGTGLVGAPACGDVMKLQIKVDENG